MVVIHLSLKERYGVKSSSQLGGATGGTTAAPWNPVVFLLKLISSFYIWLGFISYHSHLMPETVLSFFHFSHILVQLTVYFQKPDWVWTKKFWKKYFCVGEMNFCFLFLFSGLIHLLRTGSYYTMQRSSKGNLLANSLVSFALVTSVIIRWNIVRYLRITFCKYHPFSFRKVFLEKSLV